MSSTQEAAAELATPSLLEVVAQIAAGDFPAQLIQINHLNKGNSQWPTLRLIELFGSTS